MSDRTKWWDRWIVGFWAGVATASIAYPFLHPPEIRITKLSEADMDKISTDIATVMAGKLPQQRADP